jgi:hypothetical protein
VTESDGCESLRVLTSCQCEFPCFEKQNRLWLSFEIGPAFSSRLIHFFVVFLQIFCSGNVATECNSEGEAAKGNSTKNSEGARLCVRKQAPLCGVFPMKEGRRSGRPTLQHSAEKHAIPCAISTSHHRNLSSCQVWGVSSSLSTQNILQVVVLQKSIRQSLHENCKHLRI